MADSQQVVAAKLSIETDGEPAVFSEAASAVEALQGSASGAGPSLSSLTGQLQQLAAQTKNLGPAGEAFDRFAQALQKMSEADGLDEQKAAVEDALEAWREFGNQVPEILDKGGKAAKEYQQTLERLEEVHGRLAEPLSQAADQAESAMKSLTESTKSGFKGVEGSVVGVRQALNDYRRALEESGEAGEGATDEEIAQLERLEAEYDKALESMGRYRAAKNEAKRDMDAAAAATGNEVKSINDLGDVVEAASPKLSKLVGTATLMVGAFTAGYAAGEKLRNILNSLTDGAIDRFIQQSLKIGQVADIWEKLLNKLAGGTEDATRNLEELANQRRIFENLGLEGFSQDLEKNAEILSRHGRAVHDNNEVVETFAQKLGLSRIELGRQSAELVASIEAFGKANTQIDPEIFGAIIKEQIQPLLDAYERLGVDAPAALKKLAAEWSITTSTVEDSAKKHAAAVQTMVDHITGITKNTVDELKQVAATVVEAVGKINTAQLSPEGFERARNEVNTMVEAFRSAGAEIPAALVAAADKVGVFVAAIERAGVSLTPFAKGTDAAAEATGRLEVRTKSAQEVAESYAKSTRLAGEETSQFSESAGIARISIEDFAQSNVQLAKDVDAGVQVIKTVNPVAGEAGMSLEELRAKYGAAGKSAQGAGEDVGKATTTLAQGAAALEKSSGHVAATGDALEAAGVKANIASHPIREAADASESLGEGANAASEGLGALKGELAEASTSLQTLATAAGTLLANLNSLGTKVTFADQLVAELERVREAIRQTKAEILDLQSAIGEGEVEAFDPIASH